MNGNILIDFCLNKLITIATPDLPIHYPKSGRPSIIDFYLIKNFNHYSNPVTKQVLNKDHNPLLLVLNEKVLNVKKCTVFDFNKANWINFRKYTDRNINLNFHIKSKEEVDTNLKLLNNIINKAVKLNIPIVENEYSKQKFSLCIRNIIKVKNKYRRICQNYPCDKNKYNFNLLQSTAKFMVREWNNKNWSKVIINIKTKDPE